MTGKEANIELLKQRRDVLNKECPLNNFNKCKEACQSYFDGRVGKGIQDSYKVFSPFCSCALVTGIITHEE